MNDGGRRAFLAAAVFACGVVTAPAWGGDGFGMMKSTATLVRIHPPKVYISDARVTVRAQGLSEGGGNVGFGGGGGVSKVQSDAAAQMLQRTLESELVSKGRHLTLDSSTPEFSINLSVIQATYSEQWETRQEIQTQYAGKNAKGNAKYTTRQVSVRYETVTGDLSVSYQVKNLRTGLDLDGGNLRQTYKNECREGKDAPGQSAVLSAMANGLAYQVERLVVPTEERVSVLLPKGGLEPLAAFASAGLWNKYLEGLETSPPRSSPKDESYRQYALGVAYEALGYGAEDTATTLRYLEQASVHYNKALEDNPKEEYFLKPYKAFWGSKQAESPIQRVSDALVQYQQLQTFDEQASSRLSSQGTKDVNNTEGQGEGEQVVTNQSVIDMASAGLSDDIILSAINSAPRRQFDVSPNGLIQLAKGKVSKRVIAQIQTLANKKPA
jgi:hypothetical protein